MISITILKKTILVLCYKNKNSDLDCKMEFCLCDFSSKTLAICHFSCFLIISYPPSYSFLDLHKLHLKLSQRIYLVLRHRHDLTLSQNTYEKTGREGGIVGYRIGEKKIKSEQGGQGST